MKILNKPSRPQSRASYFRNRRNNETQEKYVARRHLKTTIRPHDSVLFVIGFMEIIDHDLYVYAKEISYVNVKKKKKAKTDNSQPLLTLSNPTRSENKDLTDDLAENKFVKSTDIEDTDGKPRSINNSEDSDNSNEEKTEKLTNNVKKSRKTTTRNQKINTGSSDLWIPSINCTSASCQNQNKFDSNNIQIGNFNAINQTFGLADTTADFFVQIEVDGILGLGFDALNTIVLQHLLWGVDESKFTGKINYTPVIRPKSKSIPDGFWVVNLRDAKVGGKSLKISRDAIIDTGTTLILAPVEYADAIHKKIPGSKFDESNGIYTIPCNTTAVVSLNFNGVDYDISHRDLVTSPLSDTLCTSGIAPAQFDFWIVGQTFLKCVYSAFDVGNKKVGFALSK
ncbi:aspartic peptidase domain-containing protein [Gigaspora rosea]|uniref:Aspartic peptidase domain-containing protein n=1 Tax=Gigaspora rosea TaxID=44941 RepID=A0A397VZ86_9GLOM|nr:aspartic peptidase domain-containing protein [Gigaspora rosea]